MHHRTKGEIIEWPQVESGERQCRRRPRSCSARARPREASAHYVVKEDAKLENWEPYRSPLPAGAGLATTGCSTSDVERLIPYVADFVREIDAEARRIVVDPPEGLLD